MYYKLGSNINHNSIGNTQHKIILNYKIQRLLEAKKIVRKYGKADVITATNVFAHMADLGKVVRNRREAAERAKFKLVF